MRSWLGRMPCAFSWLVFLGSALGAPPSCDQIRCWIRQLDSHDFAIYAEASRNLTDAGDAAVERLLGTAGNADAETAWRARGVLEQIALHSNESTLRHITAGLEDLAREGKPGFDSMVSQLQTRQARLQRERAVATIRSLGGRFEGDAKAPALFAPKSDLAAGTGQSAPEPPPEVPANQAASTVESTTAGIGLIGDAYVSPEFITGVETKESELVLTIDENWRGGDAGLAALLDSGSIVRLRLQRAPLTNAALEQIAAIPQLQTVELEGCQFSAEGLNRLRQRQPRTQIVVHGK